MLLLLLVVGVDYSIWNMMNMSTCIEYTRSLVLHLLRSFFPIFNYSCQLKRQNLSSSPPHLFPTRVFISLTCQVLACTARPGVLDHLQPLSPTEQSGGERVTKGRGKGKGKSKGKKRKEGDASSPGPQKRQRTNSSGKDKIDDKGKKAHPKAKATPKRKSRSQKAKSAEKGDVGTRGKGKGGKDTDKTPTQAQLAIRARNSRKSSAYHQAYKKALAAGLEVEDAKAKGQAVTQDHLEDLFIV